MRRQTHGLVLALLVAALTLLAPILGAHAARGQQLDTGPAHGGTLRVAFAGGISTFDPAQSYNNDWFLIHGTFFDGLYRLDRTGQPELDLAAAPPMVSADGKTWTFTLRKGVRFSNGLPMTADDVKFTILRTLDPHLKPTVSWGQPTDDIFVGSHAYVLGKTTDVPGIQVLGPYTIRFVLTQPTAVLPFILTSTFNFVVSKAVVTHESADYFRTHPVGTGPFMLQSYRPGVQAVFVRNPYYFRTGKPYVDKLVVDMSDSASLIALRIEKGELDGFGQTGDIAAADLQQARSDPKYAHYLVTSATVEESWLNLNVHAPPLDSLKLRQAIAMAIDGRHLVQLMGGTGAVASQLYVPVDSQYDPALEAHPIYRYDPHAAAALVKASGYHGQQITVYYANDTAYEVSEAPGVQQELQQIGLTVSLRGVGRVTLLALQRGLSSAQISFQDFGVDFPDAYDVYSVELSCSADAAGGSGAAHYCDPVAEALVNRAEALPLGAARNALLRQAQRRLLASATRVPLVALKNVEMVSPRVRGFYYEPVFGWQYEDCWLAS